MMTSSNGNIFRVTGHLSGDFTGPREFPPQRPVMRSFDVFFDLRLNKRLSKQSWGWWFETPSCPSWRHCNVITLTYCIVSLSSLQHLLSLSRKVSHCQNSKNLDALEYGSNILQSFWNLAWINTKMYYELAHKQHINAKLFRFEGSDIVI